MNGFSKEENLILALLREEITGEEAPEELYAGVSFKALFEEAIVQTVPLLIAAVLKRHMDRIPADETDLWEKFSQFAEKVAAQNVIITSWQDELTRLMGDRPFVILKGLSAAAYYPEPELRSLGDVDYLIPAEKQEEFAKILKDAGYAPWDTDHVCHVVFRKGKAHLEMHFEIAGIPYGEPGNRIRERMKDAARRGHNVKAAGTWFPTPFPQDHALVLLLHFQHHLFGEGVGLRHLMDWACFMNSTAEKSWWPELAAFFREIGLGRLLAAVNRMSVRYLGAKMPEGLADQTESGSSDDPFDVETVSEELMRDILSSGNFGRKDLIHVNSGRLISEHGKNGVRDSVVKNSWRVLVNSTESHYPVVKKHKVAYAVFVPVRACQLTARLIREKTFKKSVLKNAKERKRLYAKLKLFEMEKEPK